MASPISREQPPLIVIVGPTASGKTALAIELAERFKGEIICADSRTVYKGMNIGTAKPNKEERQRVPHWGIDLVEPGEYFSAAFFKEYANNKIQEIRSRGSVPFLVGGTGLYIDAILFDYEFGGVADPILRAQLEKWPVEELYKYCYYNNIELPQNYLNKRYVIRAIEQNSINTKRQQAPLNASIIVGITTPRDELRKRIQLRSEQLFQQGVVEEAIVLGKKYGWENEAMKGNIYPLIHKYVKGEFSLEEVKERFAIADWRLAKRQMTWLKRNPFIWWGSLTEVRSHLLAVLANE